jgi:hypothetical protein
VRKSLILAAAIAAVVAATPLAGSVPAHAAAAALPFNTIWTVDATTNSLHAYPPRTSAAATPVATVSGASTGLDDPTALAVDSTGKVFVANAGNDSITEYAANASGNAAPIATITGDHTGLEGPSSLVLVDGLLWVTNPVENLVEAFSAGTHGNEFPAETIAGAKTKLNHPTAVTVASGVSAISVLNTPTSGSPSIVTYFDKPPGNITPSNVIANGTHTILNHPTALLSNDFESVWVANAGSNSVSLLFTVPIPSLPGGGVQPTVVERTIHGAATKLDRPVGLGHDALNDLLVANGGDHSVRTYVPKARGNTGPLRTVAGIGTVAGSPQAAQAFGAAPGRPTNVKVKIRRGRAHLSWTAPASTGGGVIGYTVEKLNDDDNEIGVLAGSGFLSIITEIGGINGLHVDTHSTRITKKIKPGHNYAFVISAVNAFGTSGFARPIPHAAILTPPGAPKIVKTLTHKNSIAVFWNQPRDGGAPIHSYRIQYGTCVPGAKGCTYRTKVEKRSPPFAILKGLRRGATYHIRVIARNKKGAGKPSHVVGVKL